MTVNFAILLIFLHLVNMAESNSTTDHEGDKPSLKKEESEAMRQSDKGIPAATSAGEEKKQDSNETDEQKAAHHDTELDKNDFPTTLGEFKYAFNEAGELRHTETDEPFEFMVKKNDMGYNQRRYEALGEIITKEVYDLLETRGNLKKLYLPEGANENEARSFIFLSEDALEKEKLLILIHGSGVVRAGQWTRKLIINEDLDHGTQLPYIKSGMELGYGILVLNTNYNTVCVNGVETQIKGHESPENHGYSVWKDIVLKAKAKHIAIVAHSFGGVVTAALADHFMNDFEKRVFAIAFTDSVHSVGWESNSGNTMTVEQLFNQRAVNWVSSRDPRDTPVWRSKKGRDAPRVSAGHEKHEWTSWAAYDSVFEFLKKKLTERTELSDTGQPASDRDADKQQDSSAEPGNNSTPAAKPASAGEGETIGQSETTSQEAGKDMVEQTPHALDEKPLQPMETSEQQEAGKDKHSVVKEGAVTNAKDLVAKEVEENDSKEPMDTTGESTDSKAATGAAKKDEIYMDTTGESTDSKAATGAAKKDEI